ncbi:methylated-DNA--[protein]-cysteine S-methyltransferase [Streptomyces xiamenensis]|uniref:Methylated-DNA--protein-cysteine methyltransferase n=1 Tax=Streptomyces xiamenensis TaxID=408015 RepID=A0A0F7FTV7_9ACTN|nr:MULTISPECIES: methylated-DNA--[protein]-cysteine S-methyltransferase [Streptomyces]AKG43820.1 methylated-DNA-protein-cysteinemethyltransferase [Streptomyces xiamenensis]
MTTTTVWTRTDSPVGELVLVGDPGGALSAIGLPESPKGFAVDPGWRRDDAVFADAVRQLAEYFAGRRTRFELTYLPLGSEFRRRVWAALEDIPYGTTTTYGAVAEAIGASRAAVRAVGGAIGANPLMLVRPCHRVIGADGSLTGYAGGIERKRLLLEREGAL